MAARNPFLRYGAGLPSGYIEMPTWDIPPRCLELCSWSVVRMATGKSGPVSRLQYPNAACWAPLHRHVPQREAGNG